MKKSLQGMMALFIVILSLAPNFSLASNSGGLDFAVSSVDKAPCLIPSTQVDSTGGVNLFPEINYNGAKYLDLSAFSQNIPFANYQSDDWKIGSSATLKNLDGSIVSKYASYELLEVANDKSWYRVIYRYNNPSDPVGPITQIYKTVCYQATVNASGSLPGPTLASDSTPSSMTSFFDLMNTRIAFQSMLVASDIQKYVKKQPLPDFQYVASGSGVTPDPKTFLSKGTIKVYGSMMVSESSFAPGDSLDLYITLNNTFDFDKKTFARTFWNGLRHYNSGPTIKEANMENNYYRAKNFVTVGSDHPIAPQINSVKNENGKTTITWDPINGVTSYMVDHLKDDLDVTEFDWHAGSEKVNGTSYEVPSASKPHTLDCYVVRAVGEKDITGPVSDQVCTGSPFKDVDSQQWYGDYTNKAVAQGIIAGYTGLDGKALGIFGPSDQITKAQALKMAAALSGRYINKGEFGFTLPYTIPDKFKGHWAYDYIWSAHTIGLDLVSDINHFNPDENITRGELVHLLAQSMEVPVSSYSHYDFSDISGYQYANDIQFFKNLGIVSGYANSDKFGPNSNLLRAEAAKIFVETGGKFMMTHPGQVLY